MNDASGAAELGAIAAVGVAMAAFGIVPESLLGPVLVGGLAGSRVLGQFVEAVGR